MIGENLGILSKDYNIPLNDLVKMNPYEYAVICGIALVHRRSEQREAEAMERMHTPKSQMVQVTGGPPMDQI